VIAKKGHQFILFYFSEDPPPPLQIPGSAPGVEVT
jgi:hypothetical protein